MPGVCMIKSKQQQQQTPLFLVCMYVWVYEWISEDNSVETVLSSITQIMGIELMSPGFHSMLLNPLSRLSPVTLISAGSIAEDSSTP